MPGISKTVLLSLWVLLCAGSIACAEDGFSRLGVTLGNPWLGVKYDVLPSFNLEFRTTFDPEVKINYFRGSYAVHRKKPVRMFAGIEYGTITFDMDDISGHGTMTTPFFGTEYALNSRFSLAADIGYSLISLTSEDVSLSGPEYTFNIWLIMYPFGQK